MRLPDELINYIYDFYNPYKDLFIKSLDKINMKELRIKEKYYKSYMSDFQLINTNEYKFFIDKNHILIISIEDIFNFMKRMIKESLYLLHHTLISKYLMNEDISYNIIVGVIELITLRTVDFNERNKLINKILNIYIDVDEFFVCEFIKKFNINELINDFLLGDCCDVEIINMFKVDDDIVELNSFEKMDFTNIYIVCNITFYENLL